MRTPKPGSGADVEGLEMSWGPLMVLFWTLMTVGAGLLYLVQSGRLTQLVARMLAVAGGVAP